MNSMNQLKICRLLSSCCASLNDAIFTLTVVDSFVAFIEFILVYIYSSDIVISTFYFIISSFYVDEECMGLKCTDDI